MIQACKLRTQRLTQAGCHEFKANMGYSLIPGSQGYILRSLTNKPNDYNKPTLFKSPVLLCFLEGQHTNTLSPFNSCTLLHSVSLLYYSILPSWEVKYRFQSWTKNLFKFSIFFPIKTAGCFENC